MFLKLTLWGYGLQSPLKKLLKTEEQRKLFSLEMDYLRRSARVLSLQEVPNTAIMSKMQAEQSILDRIQKRQLKWYGPP